MDTPRPRIAVFGSSTIREGDEAWDLTLHLGRALATRGADVVTGGYSGAMEACSRGAHEAGGHVIGVTVELFERRGPVNRYVRERIHTPHLFDRLQTMIERSDGFIAVPGSLGTLTELFLTWTLLSVAALPRSPLVLLGPHWPALLDALRVPNGVSAPLFEHVVTTPDPEEAARLAVDGVLAERTRA